MGLDITYYKNLTLIDCVFDRDGEPIDAKTREPITVEYVQLYANPAFPNHANGVEDKGVYHYEASGEFRAGSYGGYNQWRECLAKLAGYPIAERESHGVIQKRHDAGAWAAKAGPFWELINFSDCEGVIGPAISHKLAKDFAEFATNPARYAQSAYKFSELYDDWQEAFQTAAQNGAVRFH